MNIEMVLEAMAGDMLHKAHRHVGKLHVCWFADELRCHPTNHTMESHPIFFIASNDEIKKGLTAGQWNLLRTKISNFLKEKQ